MENTSGKEQELAKLFKNREVWLIVVESAACAVLILTAFFGNTTLCLTVYKTRALRTPHNVYIVCLAVADMLFAVLCLPQSLAALITGEWLFGKIICQAQGCIIFILVIASLFTMTLIAVNRFFKITKSASIYRKVYTKTNIALSIAVCWITAITVVTSVFSFGNEPFRFHPGKFLCFVDMNHSKSLRLYVLSAYFFISVVILPTIVYSYYKVYRRVRVHFAVIANSGTLNATSRAFLKEAKITKVLFVTLVAFFVCWTPAICIDLFEAFHGQYTFPRQVYFFQILTFASSSTVNPVIYGLMQKELRMAYGRVLTCKSHVDLQVPIQIPSHLENL